MRAEKLAEGMTTMEAIAGAYLHLGEREVGLELERLYLAAVGRAQKIRGRRTV